MRLEERSLLLTERFADGAIASEDAANDLRTPRALERRRADEPAGHRIHLDPEVRRLAEFRRELGRDDRAQLDDRVVALALHPARTDDEAAAIKREVGSVEEHDLADLRIEHVELE